MLGMFDHTAILWIWYMLSFVIFLKIRLIFYFS